MPRDPLNHLASSLDLDSLRRDVRMLKEALEPFALFGARLLDGRHGVPASGDWHVLDTGCPTEAALCIDDFRKAMQLLHVEPDTAADRQVKTKTKTKT